jgi:hypothetical protein
MVVADTVKTNARAHHARGRQAGKNHDLRKKGSGQAFTLRHCGSCTLVGASPENNGRKRFPIGRPVNVR